jgi:hypothetical protein
MRDQRRTPSVTPDPRQMHFPWGAPVPNASPEGHQGATQGPRDAPPPSPPPEQAGFWIRFA